MKKGNMVFGIFLVLLLFLGCQKKTDNLGQGQSELEPSNVSEVDEEGHVDVSIVEPIVPLEIVVPEAEKDGNDDKILTDEETILAEDTIPEAVETDGENELVETPVLPAFPDEPKFSVAELIKMPFVIDYLNEFFDGKEYAFFDEPQNVKSRYIYFAAHYVPESPKNAFDQAVGFAIKNGTVISHFIVKDGKFLNDKANILFTSPPYFTLHGFNFYFGGSSIHVDSHFVYTNGIGSADSFHVYWYEEDETFGRMSQNDPNWQPGM